MECRVLDEKTAYQAVYHRGEIYYADLGNEERGSEQMGTRPVMIVQNDIGNNFSNTVIVVFITSRIKKTGMPTHVVLPTEATGLPKESLLLGEQVRTIDKKYLLCKAGQITDPALLQQIEDAMMVSFHLRGNSTK